MFNSIKHEKKVITINDKVPLKSIYYSIMSWVLLVLSKTFQGVFIKLIFSFLAQSIYEI